VVHSKVVARITAGSVDASDGVFSARGPSGLLLPTTSQGDLNIMIDKTCQTAEMLYTSTVCDAYTVAIAASRACIIATEVAEDALGAYVIAARPAEATRGAYAAYITAGPTDLVARAAYITATEVADAAYDTAIAAARAYITATEVANIAYGVARDAYTTYVAALAAKEI